MHINRGATGRCYLPSRRVDRDGAEDVMLGMCDSLEELMGSSEKYECVS